MTSRINPSPVIDGPWPDCLGEQTLTVAGTAVSLPSVPANAVRALIAVETAAVRYRSRGSVAPPTTTEGIPLPAGAIFVLDNNLDTVLFIAQSGTATLQIEYY